MSDVVALSLAAGVTVLATGVGALPVAVLGATRTAMAHAGLSGFAGGAMAVASVVGLLVPGVDDGGVVRVAAGALAGAALLVLLRRRLGEGRKGDDRGWLVVVIVLFAHSLPEGFAIGTAFASDTAGLGAFVVLAIALQNIPEGTATAMPMQEAGFRPAAQVAAAIGTSLPQLPGALAAFLLVHSIEPLLPVSFGFAAGAMLALTVHDLLPDALASRHRVQGLGGLALGGAAMIALSRVAAVG